MQNTALEFLLSRSQVQAKSFRFIKANLSLLELVTDYTTKYSVVFVAFHARPKPRPVTWLRRFNLLEAMKPASSVYPIHHFFPHLQEGLN